MSLTDRMMEKCVMLQPSYTSDGEGGRNTEWSDGDEFDAAVIFNSSAQDVAAEKMQITSLYTVTTARSLQYHDVFRRASDGQVFRVVSDIRQTPDCATFFFRQYLAEKWRLP